MRLRDSYKNYLHVIFFFNFFLNLFIYFDRNMTALLLLIVYYFVWLDGLKISEILNCENLSNLIRVSIYMPVCNKIVLGIWRKK